MGSVQGWGRLEAAPIQAHEVLPNIRQHSTYSRDLVCIDIPDVGCVIVEVLAQRIFQQIQLQQLQPLQTVQGV